MREDEEDRGNTEVGTMLRNAMQLTRDATAHLDTLREPPPGTIQVCESEAFALPARTTATRSCRVRGKACDSAPRDLRLAASVRATKQRPGSDARGRASDQGSAGVGCRFGITYAMFRRPGGASVWRRVSSTLTVNRTRRDHSHNRERARARVAGEMHAARPEIRALLGQSLDRLDVMELGRCVGGLQ